MLRKHRLFLLSICIFTLACTGPKSLTKKGNKFSESGIHKEAIEYYIKALSKKQSYVDALIGLRNSSQVVLNEYSSEFFKSYEKSDYKNAVYNYLTMEEFVNRVNKYKADLNISSIYTEDFIDAKKKYLASRFEEANELIGKEQFQSATNIFDEIEKIEPNFEGKNFESLKEISLLEPKYRSGLKAIADKKFRNAYYDFKFIFDNNPNYKDSRYKKEEALEKAQFSIGILKFENLSNDPAVSEYISSSITQEIINSKNPFIQLIDRTLTDKVVSEQMMTYEGITNGSIDIKLGELIGAKALLSGTVLKVTQKTQQPRGEKTKAYLKKSVKKYNATTKKNYYETTYSKTEYMEYYGYNEISIVFKYQLVSAETGQILTSDVIEKTLKNEVNYATYSGNSNNLVPGTWKYINTNSPEDKVETQSYAQQNLKNLFKANTKLVPISQLQNNAEKEIAKISASKILAFNPEN